VRVFATGLLILCWAITAFAQGQDGTRGDRNLQIIAELLPGIYDNANQHYFDERLNAAPALRHPRTQVTIERVERPDIGSQVFSYAADEGDAGSTRGLLSLSADADPRLVRMTIIAEDERVAGCDLRWRRDLGQFTATSDCGLRLQLDPNGLWIGWDGDRPLNELSRARIFSCYVDIPGVAGGRNESFDRYPIDRLHDQGDLQWIDTRDGRRIGITLRNVQWPMNNELDAFTRNSLVMYVIEQTDEGIKTHSYGWTEPRAERIGLNLQWLLVNCYRVSNRDVRPFFDGSL
jgi:hypothetical protein